MAKNPLLADLSSELTALVESAARHVVGVSARAHRPASGLALGGDLVLAADHTIEREADITVSQAETRYEATLVARDPASDLALLRVRGLAAGAPSAAPLPGAGALVVSIARTAAGTVSTALGVVTSIGGPLRTARGVVLPQFIRTDAALRPGTAGGVIVDAAGGVIGVTTPALLRGLPVAIPFDQARAIADRLSSGGPVARGYLGVSVQPVKLPLRQRAGDVGERGLLVSGIAADSAADRAGLLVGDVLIRFNDRDVAAIDDLQDALAAAAPGSSVPMTILRGGATQQASVTVATRAQP
jgi:S1-C subfamily serine protease